MSMSDAERTITATDRVPCTTCARGDVRKRGGMMHISVAPDADYMPIVGESVTIRVETVDALDVYPFSTRTVRGVVRSVDKAAEYPRTVVEIEEV